MEFDSSQAEAQTTYKGQAYYFCSEECRRTFDENPKEFVGNVAGQDRGSEGIPPIPR
jgi:YHS domain-containing protein